MKWNRQFTPLLLSLLIALPACTQWFTREPAAVTKAKPLKAKKYTAGEAIEHLALAQLTLSDPATDAPPATDLEVIEAYARQPGKVEPQMVAAIDYKAGASGAMRRVLAPLTADDNGDYPALLSIMGKLNEEQNTLHNICLLSVTFPPDKDLKFSSEDSVQTMGIIQRQQQRLLDHSQKLPALDEVRQQLQLIEFYMRHRLRDAAYLSMDNAKQLLADASRHEPQNSDAVRTLSLEVERLETQLHKTLPYTL